MAVETRQITDRQQWLQWRKQFVTASRIGGLPIFDCHPYYTPLRIYAELRGVEFDTDDDNKVLRRGRWLEPAVQRAVEELRPDWKLDTPNVFICDPDIGIGCTPDFFVRDSTGRRGILQAKTVAPSVYAREWASGEEAPLWVVLQALTEAMLSNAEFAAIAVMLVDPHFMDVQIIDVPRHASAEMRITAEVFRFMGDVREGREPEPDFARDAAVLKLLMPRELKGSTIDLSGDNRIIALLAKRAELKARLRADTKQCQTIETEIKYVMGDAAMVTGLLGWGVTYKTSHYKAYSVPERDTRVLRVRDKRPLDQRPVADDDDDDDSNDRKDD